MNRDARGLFWEVQRQSQFAAVQTNLSHSHPGVLRGLHYQWPQPQAKLLTVLRGSLLDVAVDVRRGSPDFGRCTVVRLEAYEQLLVPCGFAHGFYALTEVELLYQCSDYYAPEAERGIRWDDPELGIAWPSLEPLVSDRDARLPWLRDIPREHLPE